MDKKREGVVGLRRRDVLKLGGIMGVGTLLRGTAAWSAEAPSDFPKKFFTVVSTSRPGGSFDAMCLMMGPTWEKITGQPIKIDYKVGAGGMLAYNTVMSNPADGYTFGIDAITNMCPQIFFMKPERYHINSFLYLGTIMVEPLAFLVRKDNPFKTIDDLMEEAKTKPVNVGVGQAKEYYHFAGKIFQDMSGIKLNFIHYGGGGAARTALIQGEVPVALTGLFSAFSIFDRCRGLLVFAPQNPIPDIWKMPTQHEAFPNKKIPDFLHPNEWHLRAEIARDYPARYKYLVETFKKCLDDPATKDRAKKMGFVEASLMYWPPEKCEEYKKQTYKLLDQYKGLF